MPVYFDHNATTPLSIKASQLALESLAEFGNPSSIHAFGRAPKKILRDLREALGQTLDCQPLEICLTSGASEANTAILESAWSWGQQNGRHEIITSTVEHPSVSKNIAILEERGARIHRLAPARNGQFPLSRLQELVNPKTALVSIMAANNETGTLFPFSKIARVAKASGALVHMDGVQLLGKAPFSFRAWEGDYLSLSAHKFYSLKGLGAALIRKSSPWTSLINGGAQERGRRAGTENIVAAASWLGSLQEWQGASQERLAHLAFLRDYFEARVLAEIPGIEIPCQSQARIPNTSNVIIAGVHGETLLMSLDLKGFAVSTGAACSSGRPEPSATLMGFGLSRTEAESSLRVSFGWFNKLAEVDAFVEALQGVVGRLRNLSAHSTKPSVRPGKEVQHASLG